MNCDFEITAGIITVVTISILVTVLWCDYHLCKILNRQWEHIKNLRRIIDMHEAKQKPKGRWAHERP